MKKQTQKGIAHLGILLLLLVIVAIVLAGYKVWHSQHKTSSPATGTASAAQTGQPINSDSDLNQAESSLNGQNIDSNLNPDSFNQDVQSLL